MTCYNFLEWKLKYKNWQQRSMALSKSYVDTGLIFLEDHSFINVKADVIVVPLPKIFKIKREGLFTN